MNVMTEVGKSCFKREEEERKGEKRKLFRQVQKGFQTGVYSAKSESEAVFGT